MSKKGAIGAFFYACTSSKAQWAMSRFPSSFARALNADEMPQYSDDMSFIGLYSRDQ
ncbi:hypothetical protein [Pseudolysobacter antarcticus]|uniref:hypothetical protein n=1 Tax=Pseudolysobacter antarcticus TaxID=2511995 RepID=UPI0013EA0E23|nr:hypothetical protein [Pseudolysobacter antarcticus]